MSSERSQERRPRKRRTKKKKKAGKKKPRPGPPVADSLRARPVTDAGKAAEEPLSPEEVRELRAHFRFLARHRKLLRLKPNAAEDRLLNGSQEPEHRGVCMHLLGKVDRAMVQSALSRLDDPAERTRLLDGVVRFSNDAAIVLLYLESLTESSSRADAAVALSAGFARLDFDRVSAAQMRRILDLTVRLLPARERPQLLLGLLQSQSFRAAFDSVDLPPDLAELLVPIRAVHAAVFAGETRGTGEGELARGVRLLLEADPATVRAHPEKARQRLFLLGLEVEGTDRALGALLDTFPANSRAHSNLATRYASRLLERHADERARALLERLVEHHPGFHLPARWLEALAAPRVGRIALRDPRDGWQRGFWLDRQQPVLVRVGGGDIDAETQLHGNLAVPSVAPLLVSGRDQDRCFVAVEAVGDPGKWWRRLRDADDRRVLALARDGVTILAALARAGVILPDCASSRFLIGDGGRLWLFDLLGARAGGDDPLPLARAWCETQLARRPVARALVESAESIEALAAALARG